MKTKALAAMGLMAAVTAAATGRTPAPPEPYQGIVNGTDVLVRSRPAITAYPCTRVSHPTRVTVVASQGAWLKILPLAGTFSVIEKESVRLDATGKVGTVTDDDTWIRAGGELRSGDFWAFQRRAKAGTTVAVTGQISDFYKITPPTGTYFWISGRYVTPVGVFPAESKPKKAEAGRVSTEAPPAKVPATAEVEGAAETVPKPLKVPHTEKEIKTAAAMFLAVDRLLAAEFRKPAEQQNLASIIDEYESLRSIAGGYLSPYIDARVQYISAAIQRAKSIEAVDNLIDQTRTRQKEYERRLGETAKPTPVVAERPAPYATRGVLAHSAVFPGDGAVPKRYTIYGKLTKRIIGYVQCTTGDVDLSRYVGREVGIRGIRRFESEIGLIIEAREVTVLGEGQGPPLPAAPTVIEHSPTLAPLRVGPAPAPAVVKPVHRPLPLIELLPAPKPEPPAKPKPAPIVEPLSKPKGTVGPKPRSEPLLRPRPKPARPVRPLPRIGPAPSVDGVPLIIPRAKPPVTTRPTTRPAVKLILKPSTRPAPTTTHRPLPPTGLPMIDSPARRAPPSVNEKEYE